MHASEIRERVYKRPGVDDTTREIFTQKEM